MAELSDKARRLLMAIAQNDPMAFTEAAERMARLEAVARAARDYVEPVSRTVPIAAVTALRLQQQAALKDALRRLDGDGE